MKKRNLYVRFNPGGLLPPRCVLAFSPAWLAAAELQAVKLNPPDLKRGLPFMEALAVKASAREFSEKELSRQDLSDLLVGRRRHQPARPRTRARPRRP